MSQPFMAPGPGAQPPYGSGPIAGVQPPGAMTMHPNTPVNGMYSPPTSGAPPHPGPPTMKAMPPTSTDGLTNGHFNGPQQPHRMPGYGGPADNQISNQMSNMNMNGVPQGPPKQPGIPPMQHNMSGPSQMHQNVPATGMPSYNQGMPRQTGPPSGYGMPPQNQLGMPPHSQANIPNQPSMPPHSQAGIPPSNQLGMPPHSQAGIPPSNQLGMPPHSQAGMPPSNQLGMPPHSQAGMPPSNQPSMLPHSQASIQQQPSMPPSNEPGMPPQPVMPPSNQHGMPPQPGMPLQPGMPPQPYGMPGQPPMSQPPGGSSFPPAHDGYNQPGMQPPSGPPTGPYGAQMPKPVPGMMAGPTTPGSYPPNMAPGQQPPGPGGYPAPSGPHPAQHQQPRRLNPDQMPSHIQVVEDDRRNKEGLFETGQRGALPPLVTTDFIVEDRGNCSPRFIRSSLYHVPCTADLLKSSNVPFALSITPFAKLHAKEEPPHCVDLGSLGPVRCNRCKAYMCPYMQFIDGGRRFQCCFCGCATEVPPEYFAHLDHTGRRTDAYERPELCSGAYDMVATEDYCRDNKLPNTPAFIFMLDVSYNSVKSGLVHLMCSRMKEVLQCLPREYGADESEVRIGFVTYDKEIHFYNVKGNLSQPQMLVVSDIQDVFVPLIDGFLVKLSESEAVIDSLLEQIPLMFTENTQTEIVLGPVIQAGLDAMKAADCTGKLFIFHSSLPNATAPGQLKNRDDRKLLGTEKEKTLLGPVSNFYTKLGQECVSIGCGVDLFLFPNSYVDVATIGEVPRLTGGQIYKYTYFQADLDGGRFIDDLKDNLTRNIAFDVTMRVRTSTGIRPVDFLGNFYMSNTTDIELAVVDSNKCVTVEVKHDDKLNEAEGACIQAAVLYTSISGQRRLRILNLSLNCCTQMSDLYRNCELDVIINHMAKKALRETLNSNPKQMRDQIMSQSVNILACYRKNCSNQSAEGQLILPEAMKLLPVYSNCIIKSTAVQGTEIHTDDRSWLMNLVNSMSVVDTNVFFYPTLLPLHDMDVDSSLLPGAMRCSYERLSEQGVYLLENGLSMYLWLGINVNPEWVQNVFGVQSAAQIDIDKSNPGYETQLHDFDNPLSRRVRQIIKKICVMRNRHMKLIIVRQRDKLEPIFQQYLVEDRGSNGSASYVDYLCHIHKEIRSLLT